MINFANDFFGGILIFTGYLIPIVALFKVLLVVIGELTR